MRSWGIFRIFWGDAYSAARRLVEGHLLVEWLPDEMYKKALYRL